jgi:hypothetical protein
LASIGRSLTAQYPPLTDRKMRFLEVSSCRPAREGRGLRRGALVAAKPGKAHNGAQLPKLGFLLPGDAQGYAIQFLRGLGTPLPPPQLAFVPVQLRCELALPCPFDDLLLGEPVLLHGSAPPLRVSQNRKTRLYAGGENREDVMIGAFCLGGGKRPGRAIVQSLWPAATVPIAPAVEGCPVMPNLAKV